MLASFADKESCMEPKAKEQESRFSIWLTTSMLLHLLFLCIIFIWYLHKKLQEHLLAQKKPLLVEKIVALPAQKQKNTAVLWQDKKTIQKPIITPPLIPNLVPGRQAVLQEPKDQQIQATAPTAEKQSIATYQQQHQQQQQQIQSAPVQVAASTVQPKAPDEPVQLLPSKQSTLPLTTVAKNGTFAFHQPMPLKIEPVSITDDTAKEQKSVIQDQQQSRLDQLKANLFQNKKFDPYASQIGFTPANAIIAAGPKMNGANPTIRTDKITLKDIGLGFSKYMREGNNDILIQQGNTNQPPDAQTLRMLTYHQQVARTFMNAIQSHRTYKPFSEPLRIKPAFTITLDKAGTLLHFTWTQKGSNDSFNDTISKAIPEIRLFPPPPSWIKEDPLTMAWKIV